jgi:hypothetical protein
MFGGLFSNLAEVLTRVAQTGLSKVSTELRSALVRLPEHGGRRVH